MGIIDRGLAPTPPMGFNTWNCFADRIDAPTVLGVAQRLVETGLRDLGYRYFNLDDGWMAREREDHGRLVADPAKFPMGMAEFGKALHELGLKFGIYSDAGTLTCAKYPASYGHERQDAETFAEWGVDYLKYDWCNVPFDDFPDHTERQVAEILYPRMSQALVDTGRPIVFSMCCWGHGRPWEWAGDIAHLWRTTADIGDVFSGTDAVGRIGVFDIVGKNMPLHSHAAPGGWNDPDMLEIGNGGLTAAESRAHFSLWAQMAAPLLIGTDLRADNPQALEILGNADIIAVDQDPLGRPADRVVTDGALQVSSRQLAGGDVSLVAFNTGDLNVETSLALPDGDWSSITDLWTGATLAGGSPRVTVPPHDVVHLRLRR